MIIIRRPECGQKYFRKIPDGFLNFNKFGIRLLVGVLDSCMYLTDEYLCLNAVCWAVKETNDETVIKVEWLTIKVRINFEG